MRTLNLALVGVAFSLIILLIGIIAFKTYSQVNGQQAAINTVLITVQNGQAETATMLIKDSINATLDQSFVTLLDGFTSISYSAPPGLTMLPGYMISINGSCKSLPEPDQFGTSSVTIDMIVDKKSGCS